MDKVCAVVVTYNRLNLLKKTIDALKAQSYVPLDILVVNNGSTDDTLLWLNTVDSIQIITQENSGGAGGFSTGIKYATESGLYNYVWIMDDDVIPNSNALENLLSVYHGIGTTIGFVCSRVLSECGDAMNMPQIDLRQQQNSYPDWAVHLDKGLVKVVSATFVSVLFSCTVAREVGLPIKEFFIWGDDTEYTLRISKIYPCYLVGNSIVKHLRKSSSDLSLEKETNPNRIRMYSYSYRNILYLSRKGYFPRKDAFICYLSCMKTILSLVFHFQFNKAFIVFIAALKSLFFNPIIRGVE